MTINNLLVLTLGEEHELLMLLRNEWHQNITIFSVSPSFRNPDNMDQIIRNVLLKIYLKEGCNSY